MLVEGVQPCLIKSKDVKVFYFLSAISSWIFDGSYWRLAESTLSVFGCRCGDGGGGGGGGGGGCGGGCSGDGVCGGGDGGGGGHDGGGGGEVEVVILVRRNVSMVYLWSSHWRCDAFPVSRQGGLEPFSPEIHLCCYTNTGTKYPSTLTIEMQTIF